ncbi:MAG TPA: DNA/RNA non-specific endonuclease [Gemmatimonadaceae bacterium]|nr:DNA/RNA non-specific endonuclease [Gemmatimonadaceae bacterium]
MIGARRSTRSRTYRVLASAGVASAVIGVACARDALVTSPLKVPGARTIDVAGAAPGVVVISQVYGGGGNAGATLRNDFIELHNIGAGDAVLDGWSVQYASASGTSWQVTQLSGTLAPGQFYLVQESKGAGGTQDLPNPDATGLVLMSATSGKVALVRSPAALTCGTSTFPCNDASLIADFVGFGSSASYFEGAAATGTLSNTTAALRKGDGCTDTDNNGSDFTVGAPAPRNKALFSACGEVPPRVSGTTPGAGGELGDAQTIAVTFSEPVTLSGDWISLACAATGARTGVTSGGPSSFDVNGLGDFAPGETCTATVSATSVSDNDTDDPPDTMTSDYTWTFKVGGEPLVLPETRFTEIHYDNSGDDVNEQIEVEGPANSDLSGWSIVLYNGGSGDVYDQKALSGTIPPTCGDRGVVVVPFATIQNGSPDGFALVHNGEVVQFLSYEGSFTAGSGPAAGVTSTDIKAEESSGTSPIWSLQLNASTGKWFTARRSFGRCNKDGAPQFDITFSGRQPISDPALPVGFEDQLFATMSDLSGASVTTSFTWTPETPSLASIDANGVMHALDAGQAVFRATAANGTSATYSLPTTVATLGGTADYRGNAEFGVPTDGDASDDFIITREQYTISYNRNRNSPNWVSYEFDATHFGSSVDRCDCFTHDPALPTSFTHLTTADYTGAGAFAGYGIDRGHMARSFDFTSGTLDNARSYYLSNIIPQAAAVNQGPWKLLEDSLGNLARFHDKEVYVIDGVAGSKGTVKGEGKIVMPASVWKVAVVLPRDHGLANVQSFRDIEDVIAVIMPNDPTVDSHWETYKTSVDEVERVSGYDVLALLPDKLERAVENNDIIVAWRLDDAVAKARALSAAGLNDGEINSLVAKISAAQDQLAIGNSTPAANQLGSLLNQLNALTKSGRISDGDAAALRAMIQALVSAIG